MFTDAAVREIPRSPSSVAREPGGFGRSSRRSWRGLVRCRGWGDVRGHRHDGQGCRGGEAEDESADGTAECPLLIKRFLAKQS
jgi:hypothetical protein